MSRVLANSVPCGICGELKVPGGALASHEQSCRNGGKTKRKRSKYRELFLANNGAGPYVCYFSCGEVVLYEELIVHHIDEDHTNNKLENLTATHRVCHNRHHFSELWQERRDEMLASPTRGHRVPHSEDTKKTLSQKHKDNGHSPTESAREAARLFNTGRPRSEETKQKISAAHKARRLRAQGGDAQ